jgi:sarcosine oxidase alpha subunit family protein
VPGDRALLVGDGPDLAAAGEALRRAAIAEVVGPVPTASLVTIRGRRVVTGADVRLDGRREHHAVDLVVFGERSPNLDLVLAAGGEVRSVDGMLRPVLDGHGRTTVANLFVAGSAADRPIRDADSAAIARATGRAAARVAAGGRLRSVRRDASVTVSTDAPLQRPTMIARGAMVCFCEDVRAWEIRAEQAVGYDDPELIKRRTGALTGPCQGKQCLQAFACLAGMGSGDGDAGAVGLPTARPPLRPVRLRDLAG